MLDSLSSPNSRGAMAWRSPIYFSDVLGGYIEGARIADLLGCLCRLRTNQGGVEERMEQEGDEMNRGTTIDINALQSMDGYAFEGLVADLLKAVGLHSERSKLSRDGGVDVIVHCDKPFLRGRYIVQCKRQEAPVGVAVLRELYGTVMSERAAKGILVTTSHFTSSARRFAEDKPLELINGNELIGLLGERGLLETVGSSGTIVSPQLEHLARELKRMLLPIANKIKDIQKGYIPVWEKKIVSAKESRLASTLYRNRCLEAKVSAEEALE